MLMSSQLASVVPKIDVGKRSLQIEPLGNVLDGEFDVVEVTARGVNLTNTLTFKALVTDNLSCVFEKGESESYQALQEAVGGFPVLR